MTGIEWTDEVWNPTTGCDRISPGCDNCYALTMAKRLKGMGQPKYQTDGDPRTSGPGFGIAIHTDALALPLKWRKPKRVFVNSMSDLFHDGVSDEFIASVFAVMAVSPRHTFQVLTKRHGRLRSLVGSDRFHRLVAELVPMYGRDPDRAQDYVTSTWPLPNVWLGVSVEDQKRADLRIPALLETPAAVRWLSCEPLLSFLNLQAYLQGMAYSSTAMGRGIGGQMMTWGPGLDWVVVGGESGKGARPMDPAWALSLRDQCEQAKAPFFFKQWGEHVAPNHMTDDTFMSWDIDNGTSAYDRDQPWRVGTKRAGRLLDGVLHDAYPTVVQP